MSFLLEILGRGLIGNLRDALASKFPSLDEMSDMNSDRLRVMLDENTHNDEVRAALGVCLLYEGDCLKAQPLFEEILSRDDESVPALLGLACIHDEMGRSAKALDLLNQARLIDILDPIILFCVGFCCEKLQQTWQAIDAYRASLRVCPDLKNTHERLAAIFLDQEQFESAIYHYEQLIALEPENMALYISLANLRLKVGQPEDAIRLYETAIAMDPDNWELQDDLVSAYEQAGLIPEAIEKLRQLIDEQPDFADHHLRMGDLLSKAGGDLQALGEYEQALKIQPGYLEAMVKLGTANLRLGHYEPAAQWFAKAVEANDQLLSACVGLGVAQLQAGRHKEGLASFELASKIEPNSSLLFSETARMQLKSAVAEQIEKHLGQGLTPNTSSFGPDWAAHLVDTQIERHQQAIREQPDHADLYYRLGLLFRNRGRLKEAIESFQRAVEINPAYEKALVKLGLALQEAGQTDDAVAAFQRAIDVDPGQIHAHYQLGLLFTEKHLFELAVEHFRKAQDSLFTHPDVQANIGLALQNVGLLDRAEASWRTTCELHATRPQSPPPPPPDSPLPPSSWEMN